jgi:nicotinamidase-related amidase
MQESAFSTPCIVDIVLVITRLGDISRRSRKPLGPIKPLNTVHGVAKSAPAFEPKAEEIVAQEHWCSSGFANTDLDLQLKKHGIHQLIVIGLIAHTCVEATVRFAVELGYEVTVVRDAIADYSDREMAAALEVNLPNYASAIVSTEQILQSISSMKLDTAAA